MDPGDIVLGLGGCLDIEIGWRPEVLEQLAERYAVRLASCDARAVVQDERSLLCSILGFLRSGSGGERYVGDPDVIDTLARHFDHVVSVGGTNVRAAVTLAEHGIPSTVHVVDGQVRDHLPSTVRCLASEEVAQSAPHLIVQFPAGATVRLRDGILQAERANRVIYVNDPANRSMRLSPELGDVLRGAEVFLTSGFNSMQDVDLLRRRLTDLRCHLEQLPTGALLVHEDADYHIAGIRDIVMAGIGHRVDVVSMNEQELEQWIQRSVDLTDPHDVVAAMSAVAAQVGAPTVVVHTDKWAAATGRLADRLAGALSAGCLAAGTRFALGPGAGAEEREALGRQSTSWAGTDLAQQISAAGGGLLTCVPALTANPKRPTTLGLGDAFVGGFIAGLRGRSSDRAVEN